jgi:hypothetical protein
MNNLKLIKNVMKLIHQAGILAATCLLLFACNKSETETVRGEPLTITTSANEKVVLLESNETATAVTFNWNTGIERNPTDTVTYIFRMDIANRDFATATSRDTVTDFTKSFTVGELNELIAAQWKVFPGTEIELEARIVANVRGEKFVYPEIAVTKFTVVTYAYASVPLYLAGTANPGTVPIVMPETVNGRIYQWRGLLNSGGFKFLYEPYSDLPSLNKGADNATLVERTAASQPDDLFPTNEGFYIVNVDRKNLKLIYQRVQYYFPQIYPIGDATPAGWSFSDVTPLVWNDDNPGIYVYEGALKAGELKFHIATEFNSDAFRPMVADASINSTDLQYLAAPDLKWRVLASEAGNYRITIDVSEMKIYFVKL